MDNYGIYVHIPFCKARCGYCAFCSCTDYRLTDAYFAKLYDEMTYFRNTDAQIATVYLGGGTPSSVGEDALNKLFYNLRVNFNLSHVSEITVECNPESVSESMLRCLKSNGVNRLSFGLQSVNDETLKRIGRLHSYSQFEQALNLARKLGFDNVNADLIVGLPESVDDFRNSVDVVSRLPLQHVSVYALELHEGTAFYEKYKTQQFDNDTLADMYDYAVVALSNAGFDRYEISNFAKPNRQCLHNLNYWCEGRYFAFGASASGFIGDVRYVNPCDIQAYLATPTNQLHDDCEIISHNDQANEYVMLGLRLSSGVSLDEFRQTFGKDFFDYFVAARGLLQQGFLFVSGGNVYVPSDKLYVVNSILSELLVFDE